MNDVQGRLSAPVSRRSCLVRERTVQYTEVDGRAVLVDLSTRRVHTLSPTAAVVWSRLDGTNDLEAVAEGLGGVTMLELVELARRLRAIGVVRDRGGTPAPGPDAPPPTGPGGLVRVRGGFDRADAGPTELVIGDGDEVVELAVERSAVRCGTRPVERLVLAVEIGDHAAIAPTGPAVVFERLVIALDLDEATPGEAEVDALASLAEQLPARAVERRGDPAP